MSARIVLADDSITIQKVIGLTFASEDYALQSFDNGTEALDAIRASQPDLVIADTDMPGLNGFELCAEVKRLNPRIPVILLHTTYDAFDTSRAKTVGADHASPKPFDSAELLGHIRRLLQSAASSPAAAEEFADVEPIEEIEELGETSHLSSEPEPSATAATPSFAAIEDDSGLLSSDAFGELGEGDLVTADAYEAAEHDDLSGQTMPMDEAEALPAELPHELEEIDHEPQPDAVPARTETPVGGALWSMAGFDPYANQTTTDPLQAAPATSPVEQQPEAMDAEFHEPLDELPHDEPVEELEAEAAAIDTDAAVVAPEEPQIEAELESSFDTPAQQPADAFEAFAAPEPVVEEPAEESSFTSIADSMYDMAGMDAVKPAVEEPVAAATSEPAASDTGAMMDDFEAFAAAADEPALEQPADSVEATSDPFTAFAAYATEPQVEPTPAPASDPFEQFASTDAGMETAAPEIQQAPVAPAPVPASAAAPVVMAAPSDEQIRAAVAVQVRQLVETEMAEQIRKIVSQAVEQALEDVLAKLRDRLRLS